MTSTEIILLQSFVLEVQYLDNEMTFTCNGLPVGEHADPSLLLPAV